MSHQTGSSEKEPSVALPIIALVTLFCCFPIGLVLAIVSIVKYGNKPGAARVLSIIAVVLIVPMLGINAAVAIPNVVKFQCRSKQSEAKMNLRALHTSQEAFKAESGKYGSELQALGFAPGGAKLRYDYVVVEAGPNGYRAEARGKDEMVGDLWVIDNTNAIQNVTNRCSR